jgi:hypothetical protein
MKTHPFRLPSSACGKHFRTPRRGRGWAWCGLALAGCGGNAAPEGFVSAADSARYEGPPFFEQNEAAPATAVSPQVPLHPDALVEPSSSDDVPLACVIHKEVAELVAQPVDIILLLDNSGSMSDELEAVEANININFASILTTSEVDYRVILISRHRQEPRDSSEEASTSICVSSPLSGLSDCTEAEQPVFSDRFFQYSTKLESFDSFDVLLDTYEPPFDDDEREEKFDQAPFGWSAWLRPKAKKVFLEMTDDDEDMPIADFVGALVQMGPEHFGSDPAAPTFVFHSIIGLAEKAAPTEAYLPDEPVETQTCTGNDNKVQNAGESYQELSRLTGGLRFPLCQFGAYDVVFQRIAEDVVQTRAIACDLAIPPAPPGLELDLNKVAIEYAPGNARAAVKLGQALTVEDCPSNAFYIANDRLNLCPSTCSSIRSDPVASLTVLFTCESQLILPR